MNIDPWASWSTTTGSANRAPTSCRKEQLPEPVIGASKAPSRDGARKRVHDPFHKQIITKPWCATRCSSLFLVVAADILPHLDLRLCNTSRLYLFLFMQAAINARYA